MKPVPPLSTATRVALLAVCVFAGIAACIVFAQHGFTSSSRRGEVVVFVPAPLAYVAAALFLALSLLALGAVLRASGAGRRGHALSALLYAAACAAVVAGVRHGV